ncbi:hypothetical protein [Kribbella turkmenica]|nr:hypothetical protein [Kribbella turkmenica]
MTNLQDRVQRRLDELAETELGLQVAVYHAWAVEIGNLVAKTLC